MREKTTPWIRTRRARTWTPRAASIAVAAAAASCAAYSEQPLDPQKVLESLRAKSVEDPALRQMRPELLGGERSGPFDLASGLDERELVAIALTLNPRLQAERLEIGEAEALLISAGVLPNPSLSVDWRAGLAGANGYGASGELLIPLLRWNERSLRTKVAEARVEEARAHVIAEEWRVVGAVRLSRLQLVRRRQLTRLLEDELRLREQQASLVRTRRDLGDSSQLDVAAVEVDVAEMKQAVTLAETEVTTASQELATLLGLPPSAAPPLRQDDGHSPADPYVDVSGDAIDQCLVEGRFDLRELQERHRRSERELELAVRRQYPQLAIGPSFSHEPDNGNYLGLGASLEIPLFDRNQGEIAEKSKAREIALADYTATLHELRGAANQALTRLQAARSDFETRQRDLVPKLDRLRALSDAALESRDVGVLDWVQTQRRLLELRRSLVESANGYRGALIDFETSIGSLRTVEGLAPGTKSTPSVHENDSSTEQH